MRVEFHQLDRRWEHLRVCRPERQRRLLASLAASGQQTPIVVVAVSGEVDRYLVIDGYQRITALQQLGRDTVEAVVWPMSEVEALVLDRSLRWAEQETALEEGWLLAELERSFGCGLDELARRFDRSPSWVSRRLALVDQLPESVQQQVRSGAITAHVAMKFLVPVARSSLGDCQRMAEAFAAHRFTSREAGQLYAAWRNASPAIRLRILDQPQLFLKAQRQREPLSTAIAELSRDLGMVVAISHRANRRLAGATVELDRDQCAQLRQQVDRALHELGRLAAKIPPEQERAYVESSATERDSGTPYEWSEQPRDRAGAEHLPIDDTQSPSVELVPGSHAVSLRESRAVPAADPGTADQLQREPGAGAGRAGGTGSDVLLPSADGLLPPSWHRATADSGGGTLSLCARRGASTRHITARGRAGRQAAQGADRLSRAVLLAHVVLPVVPNVPALRLQGVSYRSPTLLRRSSRATGDDRQHPCRGAARHRQPDGSGGRDGRLCRTFRLPLPSP